MTTTTTPHQVTASGPSRGRGQLAAGIAFPVAWVVGLSVFTASTAVTSTGHELLADYHGHSVRLGLQFILTQGLAAALLSVVIVAVAGAVGGFPGRTIRVAGLAAVSVSFIQCVLGVLVACVAVPARNAHATAALSEGIDRLDGLKMTLLAVTFACLAAVVGTRRWPPTPDGRRRRPLVTVGFGATAAALLVSAAGYLTLNNTWASAAYTSLPLLLASVTTSAALVYRDVRTPNAPPHSPAGSGTATGSS
jgi:hypothetical protein